jgi:hypothetical protein
VYFAVVLSPVTAWQVVTFSPHLGKYGTVRLLQFTIDSYLSIHGGDSGGYGLVLRTTGYNNASSNANSWMSLYRTVGLLLRAGVGLPMDFVRTDTTPLPCVGLPWLLPGDDKYQRLYL